MDTVTDLIRWDVPFAEVHFPSVGVVTERRGEVATLVVAPTGIDQYPQYLVRVDRVIALLCYEEAFAFDRGYHALTGIDASICAYRWIDSPWLRAYRQGEDVFGWQSIQHYLVLGGDSIVELIACGEPTIERIDKRTILETKHEV